MRVLNMRGACTKPRTTHHAHKFTWMLWVAFSLTLSTLGASSLLATPILAPPILAHGGGTPQLTDEPVGPYRIYVWTQPEPLRAGDIHLTVGITQADSASGGGAVQAVSDAKVVLQFVPINMSAQPFTVEANLQESLGSIYYETDTALPVNGEWEITVAVDGLSGSGKIKFQESVLPAVSINMYVIGAGLLLLFALLGMLVVQRIRHSENRNSPRKKTGLYRMSGG